MSLDLAHQRRPMVAVYWTGFVKAAGAPVILTSPHRLLPNIVARRRIVPEFVPHMGGAAPVAKAVEALLTDQRRLRAASDALREVLVPYQGHHPDQEAAEAVLRLARGRNPLFRQEEAR